MRGAIILLTNANWLVLHFNTQAHVSSLSSPFWVIYKPYIGFPSNLNTVVCRVGLLGQSFKLSTLRTLREFVAATH